MPKPDDKYQAGRIICTVARLLETPNAMGHENVRKLVTLLAEFVENNEKLAQLDPESDSRTENRMPL